VFKNSILTRFCRHRGDFEIKTRMKMMERKRRYYIFKWINISAGVNMRYCIQYTWNVKDWVKLMCLQMMLVFHSNLELDTNLGSTLNTSIIGYWDNASLDKLTYF
jgi:hypothetical protein